MGLFGSLALHAGIVAACLFTWTHTLDIPDQSAAIVPVDLVTVADQTNIAPMVKEEVPAPPVPEMIQPVPQQIQEPKVEIAPSPDKALPLPKPAPTKQTNADAFNQMLNNLAKPQTKPKAAKPGTQTVAGIGAQSAMTADLRSMLQSEIHRCNSSFTTGAPHPEKLIVSYRLFLNRDGSIAQPPQLTADSAAAVASDPYMRAAAEAARRAIYECAPYSLPADRYNQWNDITFTFNPLDMTGQ